MTWNRLREINSVDTNILNEYNSRPDERVLNLFSEHKNEDIVFYGATGKWMSDLSEMILRAIEETQTYSRKVHFVSRFSSEAEFDNRFSKYERLFIKHKLDFIQIRPSGLLDIPDNAGWMLYGAGYKFRTKETIIEYANLCSLYGKVIPSVVFSHHKNSSKIVVIGSANGIALTSLDKQAPDDVPLLPGPENYYGRSIKSKEEVIKSVIETNGSKDSSKAVILRGGYMTNFTYGGLEKIVDAVLTGKEIDLGALAAFNIIGHRDANIFSLLAVNSASDPVSTLNLSGHTVLVKDIANLTEQITQKQANFVGEPSDLHLLIDGSKIESIYGPQVDSLDELIKGQIFWMQNKGYSLNIDHKVGKSL